MTLDLFLLRMERPSYDDVESAVVAAPDAATAYKLVVDNERKSYQFPPWDFWKGSITRIGTAATNIEPGILCKHVLYG